MVESLKEEAKTQAQSYINDIMDDAKLTASKEAKRMVVPVYPAWQQKPPLKIPLLYSTSNRTKSKDVSSAVKDAISVRWKQLPVWKSLWMTSGSYRIISFRPCSREDARLALHQLVTDGRIHPARIEEVVAKVRKQVEEEIIETGKRTAVDLGIHRPYITNYAYHR